MWKKLLNPICASLRGSQAGLPGTIDRRDKLWIKSETWCTVICRGPEGGGPGTRELKIVGHKDWVERAYAMALEAIDEHGEGGARSTPTQAHAHRQMQKAEAITHACMQGVSAKGLYISWCQLAFFYNNLVIVNAQRCCYVAKQRS